MSDDKVVDFPQAPTNGAAPAGAPSEVQELRQENAQLKQIIGDQTLLLHRLIAAVKQAQAGSQASLGAGGTTPTPAPTA